MKGRKGGFQGENKGEDEGADEGEGRVPSRDGGHDFAFQREYARRSRPEFELRKSDSVRLVLEPDDAKPNPNPSPKPNLSSKQTHLDPRQLGLLPQLRFISQRRLLNLLVPSHLISHSRIE